jgi:hypothetical protein
VLLSPLLTVLLAAAPSTPAGMSFEQTTVSVTPDGPAGPGVVSRVYYSGRRIRLEAGGTTQGPAFLLRLDQGRAYRLDPEARTATELDVDRLRAQAQMDASMAGDLMGLGEDSPRPRPAALRGARTIAGHACRGYRVRAGSTVMDLWLAEDLPVGIGTFAEFLEWTGASSSLGGLIGALQELRGFPLETRTRVNVLGEVHETLSTVTRVTLQNPPAALFEVPAGYTLVREATSPP